MGCGTDTAPQHISDYFYLENVFGAGDLSGHGSDGTGGAPPEQHAPSQWALRKFVGEGDARIRQNCHRMDVSCPWRYTRASRSLVADQPDVVAISSKSGPAGNESDVALFQEADSKLTQGFVFEIWLDGYGYPMPETAWASTAPRRNSMVRGLTAAPRISW